MFKRICDYFRSGSLEDEFEQYKALHKYAVLKAKMIMYYEVVLANSVELPPFMGGDTPEKCADRDIKELALNDINKFNESYEKAWCEIAPNLI